jgi:tetratricopeptide (TPR) repeat protein
VSAELAGAYAALKSGDYARATKLYAGVLQGDSLNLDAQLGMATALARGGDAGGAAHAFRMALEIDPSNSTALAGLLAVSDQSNPGALEVGLKSLLARHANSAALAFSLGNLYAAQSRWSEAQQSYFDALRIEPENADYLYNLAVSLDHLKQPRLALDYYERAMATAGKAAAQFDHGQINRRVNELKSVN